MGFITGKHKDEIFLMALSFEAPSIYGPRTPLVHRIFGVSKLQRD